MEGALAETVLNLILNRLVVGLVVLSSCLAETLEVARACAY